jgi:hypothetical protein
MGATVPDDFADARTDPDRCTLENLIATGRGNQPDGLDSATGQQVRITRRESTRECKAKEKQQ